jgi:hypothetical protein
VPATVVRTEGGGIVFEVPRNEDATDVLFAFEISSDLVNWSEIPFVEWVGPGVAKYETMTVPVRLFGRVRVEIP